MAYLEIIKANVAVEVVLKVEANIAQLCSVEQSSKQKEVEEKRKEFLMVEEDFPVLGNSSSNMGISRPLAKPQPAEVVLDVVEELQGAPREQILAPSQVAKGVNIPQIDVLDGGEVWCDECESLKCDDILGVNVHAHAHGLTFGGEILPQIFDVVGENIPQLDGAEDDVAGGDEVVQEGKKSVVKFSCDSEAESINSIDRWGKVVKRKKKGGKKG